MNYKRKNKQDLITVEEFAKGYIGWRGLPVSVQYIYKLIGENRKKGKAINFEYIEEGKKIWIKK
jgi:hypothetical protein